MANKNTQKQEPKALTIADCQIVRPKPGGAKVVVTVRCPIADMAQATQAIRVLASVELKNHVYATRHELGLAEYGIEKYGSHRPYTAKANVVGDRVDGGILGYEQDYRFTRQA